MWFLALSIRLTQCQLSILHNADGKVEIGGRGGGEDTE